MSHRSRHTLMLSLLLAGAAAFVVRASQSPSPAQTRIPASLLTKAEAQGAVHVIIGVRAPFTPEGELSGPATDAQRAAIASAQQQVIDQMPRGNLGGIKRFETIPYFAAEVSPDGLQILAELDQVTTIEEDTLSQPMLAESVPVIGAPAAWARGFTGSGVLVAILDTGVDRTHSFMGGRVVSEACYSTTSAIDGSTSVCPGGVNSTAPGSGVNCSLSITSCDHGTHVAGIAAGSGLSAGVSFSGVARNASIIAIQVFSRFEPSVCGSSSPCALSYDSDQILGLERVFALRTAGTIAAANMSLGGGRYSSQSACDAANSSTKAAIDNLRSAGIATVIASGNEGYTDSMAAPGCISSAVSVASTLDGGPGSTPVDSVSSFSNTAPFLSLLAPGELITSSIPSGGYDTWEGTSMAAPTVAGAWAVLKQRVPSASVTQVLNVLRGSGVPIIDSRNGLVFRRINVNAALDALVPSTSPPGAPTDLTASGSGSTVTLIWNAPTTGGAPTTYVVEVGTSLGASNLLNRETGSTSTSFTLNGVGSGIHYARVRARNSGGTSPASNEVTFTDGGWAPGPPSNLAASVTGTTVAFSWRAPTTGGASATYVVEAGSTPGASNLGSVATGSTATAYTVINFPSGTSYVRVRARNGAGTGAASNEVTVVVGCAPAAPMGLTGVVGGSTVTLSWNASSDGTSHVIEVGLTPGASNFAVMETGSAATTFTATNVPAGTYYVRVRARNSCGLSSPSNEVLVLVW